MRNQALKTLGGDGPLMAIPGYIPRGQQIKLSTAIEAIIDKGGLLIADAGTGTGKSYAALIPVILSGKRTVVATASIALQEQYFLKDIPKLKTILHKENYKVALLKGRNNFLCRDKIASKQGILTGTQDKVIDMLEGTGDRSRLTTSISDYEWQSISVADSDDCFGKDCPNYNECYYYIQRKKALKADLIIVNYHVLFIDSFFMKGEMLGKFETLIADEGHKVPDIARDFFEETVSIRTIERILFKAQEIGLGELRELRGSFIKQQQSLSGAARNTPLITKQFLGFLETLTIAEFLSNSFSCRFEQSKDLSVKKRKAYQTVISRLGHLIKTLTLLTDQTESRYVRWIDADLDKTLKMRILDVREPLAALFGGIPNSVLMSATMETSKEKNGFDLVKSETGLLKAETVSTGNIFDFTKQVGFYAVEPGEMPDPSDPNFRDDYIAASIEKISEIITIIGGRTLVLFTSIKALNRAKEALTLRFPDLTIYAQKDLAAQILTEQFKADDHGVLLGTRTFFEGIDIPGEALSCVILDRFPFPGRDPIVQAREQRNPGGFYFNWYLPAALIIFRQGFGRLIRTNKDHGVFIILDPRVKNKYHKKINEALQSNLPMMSWNETKLALTKLKKGAF